MVCLLLALINGAVSFAFSTWSVFDHQLKSLSDVFNLFFKDELQTLRQEQREREKKIVSEQEQANAKERDYYLKTMARMGKSEKHSNPEAKYIGMIKERQNGINRNDLRHQARELRDSCLYMGPVNEYFMA